MIPLLDSWKHSLNLLKPEEFKVFLLLSLQAVVRLAFLPPELYWGFLILWLGLLGVGVGFLGYLTLGISAVLLCLLIRPSTYLKTVDYLVGKKTALLCVPLFMVLPQITGVFSLLVTFFFLDSRQNLKGFIQSFYNAAILYVRTLPIIILLSLLFYLIVFKLQGLLVSPLQSILFIFLGVFVLTFYKKQLYEDLTIYWIE